MCGTNALDSFLGVCFFSIQARILSMIVETLLPEEISATSSTLVFGFDTDFHFVKITAFALMTTIAFSSRTIVTFDVVVIIPLFTVKTEVGSRHEGLEGGATVIVFIHFDEDDLSSFLLHGTLVSHSVSTVDR